MAMDPDYAVYPFGDAALIVETADEISESVYRRIRGLTEAIAKSPPAALIELIPSYRSLLVTYDSLLADYASMEGAILSLISRVGFLLNPLQKSCVSRSAMKARTVWTWTRWRAMPS